MKIREKGAEPAMCIPFKTKAKPSQKPLLPNAVHFLRHLIKADHGAPLAAREAGKSKTWHMLQYCHLSYTIYDPFSDVGRVAAYSESSVVRRWEGSFGVGN